MSESTLSNTDQSQRTTRRTFLRYIAGGTALSLANALLVACGGSTTPTAAPASTTQAATTTNSPAAGTASAGAIDIDKAKKEGVVQLYTSLDTQIVDSVIKPFKDKYGIDVQYYRAGSAQVTGKVLQEADAGKIQADMVDASDVGAFLELKRRGILTPYQAVVGSAMNQFVAADLRDPDGTWIADRLTQVVIQYNTDLIKTPPQHWKDLTDQQYNGKLAFFGSSAGDSAPRLYTLAKAFGYELLESYAALKPLRVDTPQLVTQALEKGERAATFNMNDNIAQRSKLQGKPTAYLFPDEGVPTEPGAAGLIKNAAHPNAAALFFDWWMGAEGQKILVEGGKYSSRTDLEPPKENPPLKSLKTLILDYAEYQANRPEILQRMAKIFGGEWGV